MAKQYRANRYNTKKSDQKTEVKRNNQKSTYFLVESHGFTKHFIQRVCERVLHIEFSNQVALKVANAIKGNLPLTKGDGLHTFMNNYKVVMSNGVYVTVYERA